MKEEEILSERDVTDNCPVTGEIVFYWSLILSLAASKEEKAASK
jgi:hypothetical protein